MDEYKCDQNTTTTTTTAVAVATTVIEQNTSETEEKIEEKKNERKSQAQTSPTTVLVVKLVLNTNVFRVFDVLMSIVRFEHWLRHIQRLNVRRMSQLKLASDGLSFKFSVTYTASSTQQVVVTQV